MITDHAYRFICILLLLTLILTTSSQTTTTEQEDDLLFDLPLPKAIYQSLHQPPNPQHKPDLQRWSKAGTEAQQKENAASVKDLFSAAYFFTAATHVNPQSSQSWHDLASSLSALASGFPPQSALILLCESKYAALLSAQLSATLSDVNPDPQTKLRVNLVTTVSKRLETYNNDFPLLCEGLPGGKQQSMLTHAIQLEQEGQHLEATRLLCRSESATSIGRTTPEINRGVLTAASSRRIFTTARICGVLRLIQAVDVPVLKAVKEAVDEHWRAKETEIQATIAQRRLTNKTMYFESEEVAMRGDQRRFELQLTAVDPYTDPALTNAPFLSYVLKLVTADHELELDTFSYVQSLPGSVHQPWHVDVNTLFHRDDAANDGDLASEMTWQQHTSPFGMVAVVPVIDVDATLGPTEFITGSHLLPLGKESYWKQVARTSLANQMDVTPRLSYQTTVGDVVLMDLRLMHRGTPNLSALNQARSILYMSFVKRWYQDPLNFKRSQSIGFDQLKDRALKSLFTRIDSRTYIKHLERFIEDQLGVNALKEMKSNGNYVQRDLRL